MDGMIRTQKSSSFLTGFDAVLLLLLHAHWLNWRKSRGIRLGTSLSEKHRTFLIAEKGSRNIRVELYKKQQARHKWSRNFTCTCILQLTLLDESIYLRKLIITQRALEKQEAKATYCTYDVGDWNFFFTHTAPFSVYCIHVLSIHKSTNWCIFWPL